MENIEVLVSLKVAPVLGTSDVPLMNTSNTLAPSLLLDMPMHGFNIESFSQQQNAKKPWDVPDSNTKGSNQHPYHIVLSERVYQKMDFLWKRNGYRSLRH